jgi:hypothetical protein
VWRVECGEAAEREMAKLNCQDPRVALFEKL